MQTNMPKVACADFGNKGVWKKEKKIYNSKAYFQEDTFVEVQQNR